MKKVVFGIAFAVIIIAAGLWIAQTDEGTTSTGPTVGATIFPIYDIARTIGGDEFNVVLILPAGASPHTFDPQPSTLKNLQGAQAVFAIGHTLDNWATNVAQAVDAPVVVVDHGIALRETVEQGHDHEEAGHDDHDAHDDHDEHEEDEHGHAHGPTDPHYWLSPMNAAQIAHTIAEELATLDPTHAELYHTRADAYADELAALRTELIGKTRGLAHPHIIALHDAWYYFAEEFGLEIVGTFEPSAGTEPSPQYLATLAEEAEEHNVHALFLEPQLSTAAISAFANDHDLAIATLDPLGGVDGRMSYVALMRYNVEQVVAALSSHE